MPTDREMATAANPSRCAGMGEQRYRAGQLASGQFAMRSDRALQGSRYSRTILPHMI